MNSETLQRHAPSDFIAMLGELLGAFEKAFGNNKKTPLEFDTLLRRKFVEKAEKYDFLDPFAAEFQYSGGRVEYSGEAGMEAVARGVMESVNELVDELGMRPVLLKHLARWKKTYSKEIKQFDFEL